MEETPQQIKTVGIVYLVAGIINLTFMWWVSSTVISTAGACIATLTMGLCPAFCLGIVPFLLIPLGLIEVVFGALTLGNPDAVKSFIKFVPFLEIASLLAGGLSSPIAGVVALVMLKNDEAVAYLEG